MLLLNLDDPESLAGDAPKIGYDSNVYMTNYTDDADPVKLYEVFSFGLHLHNSTLQYSEVANWTDKSKYLPSYQTRGNFNGMRLRGATVVSLI